jgi:hypothetical protein
MLHAVGRTEFDHAVIMVRDRLDALAPHFERQGFHLTEKAVHNLGSCNRLIVLDDTYIELSGWPPGALPARKEIADSPLGLDGLVFRTYDAEATHQQRLREAAEGGWNLLLANVRIHVAHDPAATVPRLVSLMLENRDGACYALDIGL